MSNNMNNNEIFLRYGDNNFTEDGKHEKFSDSLFQNYDLSYGAIGFLFFLLSLPKDSDFNAEDYKKVKKHDEECKLEDILLELIQFKYVLPFWKESGPVEEYRYIFNDEVFDVEATSKTIHEMIDLGYECIQ